MSPAEMEVAVRENQERRDELKAKIGTLTEQRAAFIAEEVASMDDKEESLDYQIYEAVKDQAGKKGLDYSAAPDF